MSVKHETSGTQAVLRPAGRGASPAAAAANSQAERQAGSPAVKAPSRACPTRTNGTQPLIQRQLSPAECQSKQRGMFHKCHSCTHANGRG